MPNTSERTKQVVLNIRARRTHLGYSQYYVAERLRITQNAYSKIETGDSTLNVERLYDIAQVLETTVFVLLTVNTITPAPVEIVVPVVKNGGVNWLG